MPRPSQPANIPSSKQLNYLECLFIDLGFSRTARNEFLKRELARNVAYLDELTASEASRFISALKERKEDRKPAREEED